MVTLCTLFDSNYLDKGLVLYDSLVKSCSDFRLYVLAMDDKCYHVLEKLKLKNLIPISKDTFEDDELKNIKETRSAAEYCWTCTPAFTEYVLMEFQPDICTYVDADVCFYDSPEKILNELEEKKASVLVVNHRFCKYDKHQEKISGRFCVEFNSFKNDNNGRFLLSLWKKQCFECCSKLYDGVHFADQMYLDKWVEEYPFAIESSILGAGVAPWNISDYRLLSYNESYVNLLYKGKKIVLNFYHFEKIKYNSPEQVDIGVYNRWGVQTDLVKCLYFDYLNSLQSKKAMLKEKFDLDYYQKDYPGLSSINRFNCKQIFSFFNSTKLISFSIFFYEWLPMKVNHKKNIINLNEL